LAGEVEGHGRDAVEGADLICLVFGSNEGVDGSVGWEELVGR
jgi:hypothetical protein